MLTKSGWFAATAIALIIAASGLTVYLIYPFAFLILGSLASKFNPKNEDNAGRSSKQVIANAGIASLIAFLYLLTQNPIFQTAFVVSFSVALSDTFSSEIGKKYGGQPISVCSLKPIQKGLSGGITFIGTIAGLIGSLCVSSIYFLHQHDFKNALIILIFGFGGMLIDSLIGCAFQAKYKNEDKVEEIGSRDHIKSGFHFIDNNMTNLLSILITVLVYLTLFS